MSSEKVGDLLRMVFVEYQIFTTAFAVILAGSMKKILISLVDYLIYPLIQNFTGFTIDESVGKKVRFKPILDKIIRFTVSLLVIYIAYKYRETVMESLGL